MKKLCLTIFMGVIFWWLPPQASAARLFLELPPQIPAGQEFAVKIMMDSEGENINAISGVLHFPAGTLELKDLQNGNSLVNFWIEKPAAEDGSIKFSGITPGGFTGPHGLLLTAIFRAAQGGSGEFSWSAAQLLLNDGRGTPVKTGLDGASVSVLTGGEAKIFPAEDREPPEDFTPAVSTSPYIFEGKNFLAFATQDKGSGVAGYFVAESSSRFSAGRNWVSAESPYLLKDQELHSYIFVKAVDRAGNERIAILPPAERAPTAYIWLWSIIILSLLSFIFLRGRSLFRRLWKRQ